MSNNLFNSNSTTFGSASYCTCMSNLNINPTCPIHGRNGYKIPPSKPLSFLPEPNYKLFYEKQLIINQQLENRIQFLSKIIENALETDSEVERKEWLNLYRLYSKL